MIQEANLIVPSLREFEQLLHLEPLSVDAVRSEPRRQGSGPVEAVTYQLFRKTRSGHVTPRPIRNDADLVSPAISFVNRSSR